ncbi:hypothetical protein GC173_15270 [bacterium]|nr:hypothetical protein [bacterium]
MSANRTSVSQTNVRKPWGGKLDVRPEAPEDSTPLQAADFLGPWLRKFCELLLLTTVLSVPLSYHFSLNPGPYIAIRDGVVGFATNVLGASTDAGINFFDDQVAPFLSGQMPVLATKFSTWLIAGTLLIGGYLALRVSELIVSRPAFPVQEQFPRFHRRNIHRSVPLIGMVLFLGLALVSLLVWPPAVPPEALASLKSTAMNSGGIQNLGGGGFLYSITAWFQLLFALIFFLVAEDIIRDRTFVMKILGVLIFAAVLNALVVVLLKVGFEPLMKVWIRFSPGEYRNSLGAFIGHNTGVSSFLMAPFLICLCWLVGVQPKRRPIFRLLLGVLVALFLLVEILCQSRAVIPILGVVSLALLLYLYRRSCIAPLRRAFLWFPAGIALILASQFVNTPYNPLYRQDMSLVQRVSQFRYNHLRTETRLRILWISMTQLVPEHPLIGHGWASFQYVYPKAAGRFFAAYPETELAPTPLRTPQAHNEYLQLLVENGILGVAIALASLFFLLRGGYIVLQRTIMPYHITIQAALFLSIIALLLHCMGDFPLRIPPLAMTLTVLLAIWSAGDRLWLFPLKPPADEEGETEAAPPASPGAQQAVPPVRWENFVGACLASLVLVLLPAAFAGATAGPFQSAATSTLRGQNMTEQWVRTGSRDAMETALIHCGNARRVFWIAGEPNLVMAQVQYHRALAMIETARAEANKGNDEVAKQAVSLARTYLDASLSDLALSLTELRFHGQYQLRAAVNSQLGRITTGEESVEYRRRAAEDLQETVAINPGDPDGLADLIRLLEANPEINRQEIVRHMRTLVHFHPIFFRQRFYQRMLDAAALQDIAGARAMMETLKRCIDPGFRGVDRSNKAGYESGPLSPDALTARRLRALAANDDLRLAEAQILFLEGDYDAAWDVASQYLAWYDQVLSVRESAFPAEQWRNIQNLLNTAKLIQLQDSIVKERSAGSARLLDNLERDGLGNDPTVRALRYLVAKYRTTPTSGPTAAQQAEALRAEAGRQPFIARIVADQAEKVFQNNEEALEWMELRHSIRTISMDAVELAALARLYSKLGRWTELEVLLPELEAAPGSPSIRAGVRVLLNDYRRQLDAGKSGGQAP